MNKLNLLVKIRPWYIVNMNAKMTTNSTRVQETGCGAACLRIKTHSLYIPQGSGAQRRGIAGPGQSSPNKGQHASG